MVMIALQNSKYDILKQDAIKYYSIFYFEKVSFLPWHIFCQYKLFGNESFPKNNCFKLSSLLKKLIVFVEVT